MKKLLAVLSLATFFVMASQAMAAHMLGEARNDPWNNCTSCHGVDLNGDSAPSCIRAPPEQLTTINGLRSFSER